MADQFLSSHLQRLLGLSPDDSLSLAKNASQINDELGLIEFLQELLGSSTDSLQVIQDYLSRRNFATATVAYRGSHNASPSNSRSRSQNASPSRPIPTVDATRPTHLMYSKGVWGHEDTKKEAKKKISANKSSNSSNSSKSSSKIKVDSLADIDAALQQLELNQRGRRKPCNCMATRHPLLEIAPNCLNCGHIICVKEGLGPCLQCGKPLMSNDDLHQITEILSAEKDNITSSMGRKARQKAGIEQGVLTSSLISSKKEKDSFGAAQSNLDRLLHYQETGAQRTKIIDQVSDFETPYSGVNKWATPLEQAQQLKRQQRQLRLLQQKSMARKGRGKKVISIDIRGNKVYQIEEDAPLSEDDESQEDDSNYDDNNVQEQADTVKAYWDDKNYGSSFVKPTYVKSESSSHKGKSSTSANIESKIKDNNDEERLFSI